MFTNLKKSFTSRLNDKCLVKQLINLKCVAILPCDLSLITIHISDWCHFSDICISQVATCLRLGGIFRHEFLLAHLLLSPSVKKVWKSVNVWWSYGQEFDVLFFDSQCIFYGVSLAMPWQRYWASIPMCTQRIGQLSLASLWGRLIEYQLRLG